MRGDIFITKREREKEREKERERELMLTPTGHDYGHSVIWNILSYEVKMKSNE